MLRRERIFLADCGQTEGLQICGTLCLRRATGRGWREPNLIVSHHPRRFIRRDFPFVTNSAVDFRGQFRHQAIHPGLVILIPNATHSVERALFLGAQDFIGDRDLVNRVIEVDPRGATSVIRETSWGSSASCRGRDDHH